MKFLSSDGFLNSISGRGASCIVSAFYHRIEKVLIGGTRARMVVQVFVFWRDFYPFNKTLRIGTDILLPFLASLIVLRPEIKR